MALACRWLGNSWIVSTLGTRTPSAKPLRVIAISPGVPHPFFWSPSEWQVECGDILVQGELSQRMPCNSFTDFGIEGLLIRLRGTKPKVRKLAYPIEASHHISLNAFKIKIGLGRSLSVWQSMHSNAQIIAKRLKKKMKPYIQHATYFWVSWKPNIKAGQCNPSML